MNLIRQIDIGNIRLVYSLALVFLFCCFSSLAGAQNILETPVSLSYQNQPIKYILKDVEARYPVYFSHGKMNLTKPINIQFNGTLQNGLELMLTPLNIEIELIGQHVVLRYSQLMGRSIKGRVVDSDTKIPLIGASVIIEGSNPVIGVSCDENGYFEIGKLPLGRYNFKVQYLGYESRYVKQILNSSGKETFLNIELLESAVAFREIVILDQPKHAEPLNDMASTSARSFSVEETHRYAAAISDPARMVQSFAGVSSGGDDLSNEIIIRGNSTRGLLWRLEGVEIPNPNHFAGLGKGGGAVSMLSSSTLTNSDFYTGAFPAEYGNALSGVFDLRLRNGNSDKREHSIAVGNLGLESSTEGYFKKGKKASYLINFRYSTIQFIRKFLPSIGNETPAYRDFSFKINIPTEKAGNFSIFGLGGWNHSELIASRDSLQWVSFDDATDRYEKEKVGIVGVTHRYLLNDNSYIKSSIAGTAYSYYDLTNLLLNSSPQGDTTIDESDFINYDLSGYFSYHYKINAKNKIRTGFSISQKNFSYDYLTIRGLFNYEKYFKNSGSTQFIQSFFQWKNRINNNWEINAGLNFSYLVLNKTYAIDPRMAFKWQVKPKQAFALSVGLHGKPEHISTYFIERTEPNGTVSSPNLNLSMPKALHFVFGYDRVLANDIQFKIETYYQYLLNIPVSDNPNSGFSVLNSQEVFDIISDNGLGTNNLVSDGKGENYGIDFTLEKPFSNGYYFLCTGSLFDSKYTAADGYKYHTVNANNYIFNLLGGKEWKVGTKGKNILGLNGKFTYYGGRRDSPIDLESSRAAGFQILERNSNYTIRLPDYIRFDVGISYKINTLKQTHSFHLDVQNVANRFNVLDRYYDYVSKNIKDELQNGLIPFVVYRIQI